MVGAACLGPSLGWLPRTIPVPLAPTRRASPAFLTSPGQRTGKPSLAGASPGPAFSRGRTHTSCRAQAVFMKPLYLETEFKQKWANVSAVQDARGHRQLEREGPGVMGRGGGEREGLGLGERWWRERPRVRGRGGPQQRVHNKEEAAAGWLAVHGPQLWTVGEQSPRCSCRGTHSACVSHA